MTRTAQAGSRYRLVPFSLAIGLSFLPPKGPPPVRAQACPLVVCNGFYSISTVSQSFDAGGGTGTIGVSAGLNCFWTAASDASWIAITSGGSSGPCGGGGTVNYAVAVNPSISPRTGTVKIGTQTFTVFQDGREAPDPLIEEQWHLKGRGLEPAGANVRTVWTTTKGKDVVIGIVDDGLQHAHPDLQPNYRGDLSRDFNFNDPDPSPGTRDPHGTAVAGVAAARGDNGIGVSGVAPRASLAGLRLIARATSDADEAAALGYQNQAIHISSNSWGPSDNGRTLAGPGPLTEAAIQSAATTGRGGRGEIFVWAAGNGRQNADNCNFDGYANSRYVIAVGALADDGKVAYYSEPCSAMFVTAPSNGGTRGITTTDLLGASGYDPGDYTSTFGGTSSATPLVGGVVALMLASNPSLTWRDVKHILVRTSKKVDATDPGWSSRPFPHNESYGFGLIDAEAAVKTAATWVNVLAPSAVPPVEHSPTVGTPIFYPSGLPIPDNDSIGVADVIRIGTDYSNFLVEHVDVKFTAFHPYRGDLEVTLTSPSGVVSRLATVRPSDGGRDFTSWHFRTVRHWGETAAGPWTLRVADRLAADAGTWIGWTLSIYGTVGGPQPIPPDPHMAIDLPAAGATLKQPFRVAGWAIDRGATSGTGVSAIHVWAHPSGGGAARFVGVPSYGGARADVGSIFGSQFTNSGFNFVVAGLSPGTYQLVAYAYSTVSGSFNNSKSVTVTVQANPHMAVDVPANGSTVNPGFLVSGWALDLAAASGTGADAIHVWAHPSGGGSATFLGATTPNWSRPDVGAVFGSQFTNSGYGLTTPYLSAGTYQVVVYAHSTVAGTFNQAKGVTVTVRASDPLMAVDMPAYGSTVSSSGFVVAGWAIDRVAPSGTGVDAIHVWAYPATGPPFFVGVAPYGGSRPDVGSVFGGQYTNSGYNLVVSTLAPGTYDLVVYAHSTVTGTFNNAQLVRVTVTP